jgi:hypothetical protein
VGTPFSAPCPRWPRICLWATSSPLFSPPCSAALSSGLPHSWNPRQAWGFWLMLAHAGGVACFIADLVVLSRDRRPATSTLRNMQLDATGRLGQ